MHMNIRNTAAPALILALLVSLGSAFAATPDAAADNPQCAKYGHTKGTRIGERRTPEPNASDAAYCYCDVVYPSISADAAAKPGSPAPGSSSGRRTTSSVTTLKRYVQRLVLQKLPHLQLEISAQKLPCWGSFLLPYRARRRSTSASSLSAMQV